MATKRVITEKFEVINHDEDKHLWCGPAVICAYTGLRSSDVYDAVKHVKGSRNAVKGMYFHELNDAMKLLGWAVDKDVYPNVKMSLLDFSAKQKKPAIVMVPEHFIMVENGFMVDSMNPNPVRVETNKYAKSRVLDAYTYKRVSAPKLVKRMVTGDDNADSVFAKAKKMARENGIDIEYDSGVYLVSYTDSRIGELVVKEVHSKQQVYTLILDLTEG